MRTDQLIDQSALEARALKLLVDLNRSCEGVSEDQVRRLNEAIAAIDPALHGRLVDVLLDVAISNALWHEVSQA